MSTIKKTSGAQWPLVATFEFDIAGADAMVATNAALVAFSAAANTVYDLFTLPYNSQVIGGDLTVKTVSNDTGTSTIALGDSGTAARYLAATNFKAAARTAVTPTGYATQGEALRMTIANQNGNATTGKAKIVILFLVDSRQTENLKTT